MARSTLRKYLIEKRVELYETINELKSRMLEGSCAFEDEIQLAEAESKLNLVKEIITICQERNHY